MDTNRGSGTPSPEAERIRQAIRRLRIALMLIAVGVAVAGVVRHELFLWVMGIVMVGGLVAQELREQWTLGERGPGSTPHERSLVAAKAYLVVVPLMLVVHIGFVLLFPTWFPAR